MPCAWQGASSHARKAQQRAQTGHTHAAHTYWVPFLVNIQTPPPPQHTARTCADTVPMRILNSLDANESLTVKASEGATSRPCGSLRSTFFPCSSAAGKSGVCETRGVCAPLRLLAQHVLPLQQGAGHVGDTQQGVWCVRDAWCVHLISCKCAPYQCAPCQCAPLQRAPRPPSLARTRCSAP